MPGDRIPRRTPQRPEGSAGVSVKVAAPLVWGSCSPLRRSRRRGASVLMQPMIRRVTRVRAAGVEPERDAPTGVRSRDDRTSTAGWLLRPPRTTRLSAASRQTARATSGEVRDCCGGPVYDQLVTKYMAAENKRSGCLLVTLARDRKWRHPDSGARIGLPELETLLTEEAERVVETMGGAVALCIHLLDLRPRLPSEKERERRKKRRFSRNTVHLTISMAILASIVRVGTCRGRRG